MSKLNSFGTQVTLYCVQCDENIVFVNTHIAVKPVFQCPYCEHHLNITIVNIKTGMIREKYLGEDYEE